MRGGAKHNSSRVAVIGLADVVDSRAASRQLIFEPIGNNDLLFKLRSLAGLCERRLRVPRGFQAGTAVLAMPAWAPIVAMSCGQSRRCAIC